MRKFIILALLMTVFCGIGLGAVETQITAERFKHADPVFFVYQPTQTGDWYRWRIATPLLTGSSETDTYPCLAGVTRGKVYAGVQKHWDEKDDREGFVSGSNTWLGFPYIGTKTFADWRQYNKPTDMTHCRVWFRNYSGRDVARVTFYDSSDDVISYVTHDTSTSNTPEPSTWTTVPDGTSYLRVHKDTDNADYIQFVGVDWINTNSEVSPDTAGSLMMDSVGGSTRTVINDDWGQYWTATSVELALYWDQDSVSFSGNAIGGISHRGIVNTAGTVNWQTQEGAGNPANFDIFNGAFATYKGQKSAVDYTILDMTGLDAAAGPNYPYTKRGSMDGKLVFGISGVVIYHKITSTENMDVYQFYTTQCRMPSDVDKCYFSGDSEIKSFDVATIRSPVKSTGVKCWGGANKTVYDVIHNNIDENEYFKYVFGGQAVPRVFASAGNNPKIYMNMYDDTDTAYDLDTGNSISTRFRINLIDESLGAVGATETTEISIMGPTIINILGPN